MTRNRRTTPRENLPQLNTVKRQHTVDEIARALAENGGRVYPAAKQLGMSAVAIYDRMKRDPSLAEQAKAIRDELLEAVETKFLEKVEQGDTTVLIFLAKTLGKDRGYTERQEVTGASGGPVKITFEWSEAGDNGGHEAD